MRRVALKPMYSIAEIAKLLNRSRWSALRWLKRNQIPYVQAVHGDGRRGTRIDVLLSDLRTHQATLFASIQESLENHSDDAA
jgi:IS30 family transposase